MSDCSCASHQNQTYFCCFSQEENHIYLHLVTKAEVKCSSNSSCKRVDYERELKQINLDCGGTVCNKRNAKQHCKSNGTKVPSRQKLVIKRSSSRILKKKICEHSELSCCDICCSGNPDGKSFCCEQCIKAAETEKITIEKNKISVTTETCSICYKKSITDPCNTCNKKLVTDPCSTCHRKCVTDPCNICKKRCLTDPCDICKKRCVTDPCDICKKRCVTDPCDICKKRCVTDPCDPCKKCLTDPCDPCKRCLTDPCNICKKRCVTDPCDPCNKKCVTDPCNTCQQYKSKPKTGKSKLKKKRSDCVCKTKPGRKKNRGLFSCCKVKKDRKRCKDCSSSYVKYSSSILSITSEKSEYIKHDDCKRPIRVKTHSCQPKNQRGLVCTSSTTCYRK